jgi:hypothetical protein
VERKCAFCGRKVKIAEDWVRAQLLTGCAVFHWACFIALMNGEIASSRRNKRDRKRSHQNATSVVDTCEAQREAQWKQIKV